MYHSTSITSIHPSISPSTSTSISFFRLCMRQWPVRQGARRNEGQTTPVRPPPGTPGDVHSVHLRLHQRSSPLLKGGHNSLDCDRVRLVNLDFWLSWHVLTWATWLTSWCHNLTYELVLQLFGRSTQDYHRFTAHDVQNGRSSNGEALRSPPVTHDEFKKYVKKMHLKWKRETAQPKEVAPRNFAAEQLRQDAEAMSRGRCTREVFKPGTAGEPSDGL